MLSNKKVTAIMQAVIDGTPQRAIAKQHHISRSMVSEIARGAAYKHVPWPGIRPVKKAGGQRTALQSPDDRVRELEADVLHLTEERNRARVESKANIKIEGLFHAVVQEMETRVTPVTSLPKQWTTPKKSQIVEHAVMHLSDGHHDQVVTPEQVGGLENHNFQISCARAERYVQTVLEWTQTTMSPNFHFPVLWVLAYGDFTSGEIHKACERSYYRNQFKNCLAIGQLHALMFRDIAPHFKQVNVVYLAGNHGRRSPKKDYYGAHDNWDYLVAEVARLHCGELANVEFMIPNAWSVNLDINGMGFNVSHGDDVRGFSGVPWYGMVRRQKGLIALDAIRNTLRCRYVCVGHHHTASTLSDIDGELVVNGSWLGTDPFVYNALTGYREPTQWLHGVHATNGITWRLNCKLRHPDEKWGPQRYLIDGGREVGPI